MRFILSLSVLLAVWAPLLTGAPVVFDGDAVKTLKDNLSLNDNAKVLSGDDNPTAVAKDAPKGSLYLRTGDNGGAVYKKMDSGSSTNWREVGTGGGSKNYIENANAEGGTTGWSTYADAAAASPVDGTGGTAASTFTTDNTLPISDSNHFLLAVSGAGAQGEGVSYNFSVDNSDLAKVLRVEFNYRTNSFYADDDVTLWLYDVTNSKLIQPTPHEIKANATNIPARFHAEFQTAGDSTSYRLIFHVASTTTSAPQLMLDDVTVSPVTRTYGVPVTDWEDVEITGSWDTNVVYSGKKKRVGDHVILQVKVTASGGAPSTGALEINYPAGLTPDTDKMEIGVNNVTQLGEGLIRDAGSATYDVVAIYAGAGSFAVHVRDTNTDGEVVRGVAVAPTEPHNWADTDTVVLTVQYPVLGWSSSTVVSDSADTRVVSFIAENASAQSIPNSTQTKATWDTISKDTHGGWDSANNRYVVAVPGVYRVAAQADFANNATGTRIVHLYKNGVAQKNTAVPGNSTSNSRPNLSVELDLVAGDYIEVFAQQTSGGSLDINNGVANSYFTVSKISGPAQIAASETVHAEYDTASNALADATNVVIVWDNKIRDSHGMMNASTGVFKIPRAGVYTVSAHASVASNTDWGDGDRVVVNLNKNSVQYRRLGENTKTDLLTNSSTMSAGGSVSTYLEAGDEISIDVFQSTGAAQTLSSNVTHNYISILSQGVN